jgi:hypothetical protein
MTFKNKILLILLIFVLMISCTDTKAKIHYRGTKNLGNHLYVEFYEPYRGGAGVFAGSIYSAYFTDSMNVNIFLGTYEDHEGFHFKVDSNYFTAIKWENIFVGFNHFPKEKSIDTIIVDLRTKKELNNPKLIMKILKSIFF